MKRLITALGVALFTASVVSAEVRLSGQESSLRIQATASGPWSAVGSIDETVLNPSGDLRGDGLPAWDAIGTNLLAAWASPATMSLEIALARDGQWVGGSELGDESVLGTPQVAMLGESWIIAWTRANPSTGLVELRLAAVSQQGLISEPISLFEGRLVELVVSGDAVHVLGWSASDSGSSLALETVVFASHLPGIPQPITRAHWELGALTSGDDLSSWWPAPEAITLDDAHVGESLLVWWPQPGELRFVRLDGSGPALPVSTLSAQGQAKRPRGLVKKALRLDAER